MKQNLEVKTMKDVEIETMKNKETETSDHKDKPPRPEPAAFVQITINNVSKSIHRGHQTVAEIKTVGGIPLADELEQLIDKKLVPLADDGAVVIKGEEVFMSHVRSGASS